MSLRVFKFGGASVKNAGNIRNVKSILSAYSGDELLVVISAMGKTTNAMEEVSKAYNSGDVQAYESKLQDVLEFHYNEAEELGLDLSMLKSQYDALIHQAESHLAKAKDISKDAVYDQIVSLGELLSTRLIANFLKSEGLPVEWLDVREVMVCDDNFKEGHIDFTTTQTHADQLIKPMLDDHKILITQGFIGRAPNGLTVTLGREGSDYTAAIMAYCMDVKDLSIWKDVPGVLTADPRRFENVEKIDRMSYKEAIEMTYYGAQVIHPKTIRPLQNKGIRLHVKSFVNPHMEGTIISTDGLLNYPPIVVIQDDVVLLQISSKDFSFIAENHLSTIFDVLNKLKVKLCTMRNSAISFTICIKNPGEETIQRLEKALSESFSLDIFKDLQLYTLRYFNDNLIKKMTKNKVVLFEERMKYTIQMAVKPSLELKEKS